jgi:hypothetical protein
MSTRVRRLCLHITGPADAAATANVFSSALEIYKDFSYIAVSPEPRGNGLILCGQRRDKYIYLKSAVRGLQAVLADHRVAFMTNTIDDATARGTSWRHEYGQFCGTGAPQQAVVTASDTDLGPMAIAGPVIQDMFNGILDFIVAREPMQKQCVSLIDHLDNEGVHTCNEHCQRYFRETETSQAAVVPEEHDEGDEEGIVFVDMTKDEYKENIRRIYEPYTAIGGALYNSILGIESTHDE